MAGMKFILNCEPEEIILAARAAKFLYRSPEKSDAIVEFGDSSVFVAIRRKSSISVTKAPAVAGEPNGS